MAIAVVLLRRSLDPGRNEDYIQFSTACKFRSAYSNAWHASSNVSQISAMAYESTKTYATTCPTYGYWFGRFILGCHKRMGDKVIQDFALSRTIFKAMLVHLESDWKASLSDEDRDEIVEFACALIAGFLVGLRGEEIVKMDSSGLLKYIDVFVIYDSSILIESTSANSINMNTNKIFLFLFIYILLICFCSLLFHSKSSCTSIH